MKKIIFGAAVLAILAACNSEARTGDNSAESNVATGAETTLDTTKAKQEINAMVDSVHRSFKAGDIGFIDKYMARDGLYLGTDPDEILTFSEFRNYVDNMFRDTAAKVADYTISRREVRLKGASAVIVDQFMFPDISNKVMIRMIFHARHEGGRWLIDMYSWNMIPKNTDLPKLNKLV